MKILVLNGPNLNFLGLREPEIYGTATYEDLCNMLKNYASKHQIMLDIKQSNHEGVLIDYLQDAFYNHVDGIVFNPGAYTHTSIALLDAIKSINISCIEVHISDVTTRESFRKQSYLRSACVTTIMGKGFQGYLDAIDYLINHHYDR